MEGLALLAVVAAVLVVVVVRRLVVMEHEAGLLYANGRFQRVLTPGAYWYVPFAKRIDKVDLRAVMLSLPGQEVLTADGVTLKVSLVARFAIADPAMAVHRSQNAREALYAELQIALRKLVGGADIDTLLGGRDELSAGLLERVAPQAAELGLELQSADIRDLMLPGTLRDVLAQVVDARKQGQAALEKARGETAALRHLANATKLLDDHPGLLQLRWLEVVRQSKGNTFVLGTPPGLPPLGPAGGPGE